MSRVLFTILLSAALLVPSAAAAEIEARYSSAYGWVEPGASYPFTITWTAGPLGADSASVTVTLPSATLFQSATPTPTGGTGSAADPLVFNLGSLEASETGRIVITARAKNLNEDPEIIWKDLSAEARLETSRLGVAQPAVVSRTLGPKVATLSTARYGKRPFPLVMVEYQDISHCTGAGEPYDECTGNHTAEALDEAVNSQTSGRSLWQLYYDMSFGQLQPEGAVRPAPGTTNVPFDPTYPHRWSQLSPNGTCTGTTIADLAGTPLYPNRIRNGWYVLPGTQGYYGSDSTGHALLGAVTGLGLLFGVDDGCGPTAKITYDAASIADPDLDFNDYDTDKDGVVDFFNVAFAGDGGNGSLTATGANNVWPHKSDLQYYFTDENGEKGYVSNDQLRNHVGELMWWTDSSRSEMTTDPASGIPVWVRVGPYNVNPESAIEAMSVIAHEYGHSLGLPDFYSTGSRSTFGSWELMASDHAQFMSVFNRQELGWIVPIPAETDVYELRESKIDTGTIHWTRPDGTPYTLTGPGIHNADALRIELPTVKLIDSVPSGSRAWHSGAGNDFGCPGHTLDVYLPDLSNYADASSITLSFQSLYEIEWDWDYAFVLASTDGGQTWVSLPSAAGTTIDGFNPNAADCMTTNGNGITGVSGLPNSPTTTERLTGEYPEAQWITDRFDLTQFAGSNLLLRFAYFTDPAVTMRGWFIDDIHIEADGATVYASDFESEEGTRLFPDKWTRVSSADGVETDHAYYVELRDRVSWDFDSKGQSERGAPTWEPGVAVVYTNENHGYGNTGVSNPPAQTIVDSRPDPGNDSPNLDDAAFVPASGRERFDGCTHVDNYDTPDGLWKLPNGGRLIISSLNGVSADGVSSDAIATVIVDRGPDCSVVELPPILRIGAGYEDPDTDGSYELAWDRPAGAVSPDLLQEATLLETVVTDDAEGGMGNWVVATDDPLIVPWTQSPAKSHSGTYSFFTQPTDNVRRSSSTMTLAEPVVVPEAGTTTLTFWDLLGGELDDMGFVEVSSDGISWDTVYQTSGAVYAEQAADFALATLEEKSVDLTPYAGLSIQLRFRYWVDQSNYIFYAPLGWYVDDVTIETSNWSEVTTTDATSYVRSGVTDGTYHYRARTSYAAGTTTLPSPWSNTVTTVVTHDPLPSEAPDLRVASIVPHNKKGNGSAPVTLRAVVVNDGTTTSSPSVTEIRVNGELLRAVDTPALASGGSVEIAVQWKTRELGDGSYSVSAISDATDTNTESNESNNTTTTSVTLSSGRAQ